MTDFDSQVGWKQEEDFFQRLQHYPQLQARFEELLNVVENASGDVVKADEAEERVFQEIRLLGLQAVQTWAQRKQAIVASDYDGRDDFARKEKKSSLGKPASAKSK